LQQSIIQSAVGIGLSFQQVVLHGAVLLGQGCCFQRLDLGEKLGLGRQRGFVISHGGATHVLCGLVQLAVQSGQLGAQLLNSWVAVEPSGQFLLEPGLNLRALGEERLYRRVLQCFAVHQQRLRSQGSDPPLGGNASDPGFRGSAVHLCQAGRNDAG